MAAGKPDILMLLLNKLLDDGNVLYKVCYSLLCSGVACFKLKLIELPRNCCLVNRQW